MSLSFVLLKLGRAALTALLGVTFVFVMLRLAGDPALALYGHEAPPQAVDHFNRQFGLDRPLYEQYANYLGALARGDFGVSFRDGRPAAEVVGDVLPATLLLGGLSFALAVLLGVPAGVLAAVRPGGLWDRLIMGAAVAGYALPNFFLGVLLILLFTLQLRLLPSAGSESLAHLVMPTITLGTAYAGILVRFVRAATRDALEKPFIPAARGRGFTAGQTVWRHAVPNAALPTVTVTGLLLGGLISGAVVTETVFAWPGAGRLLVTAVGLRDLPVVQLLILLVTLTMVATNLAVDLLYGLLDPRVRAGGRDAD